eukprot:scaffold5941_cov125-Isochrysis_galbana.AAC.7
MSHADTHTHLHGPTGGVPSDATRHSRHSPTDRQPQAQGRFARHVAVVICGEISRVLSRDASMHPAGSWELRRRTWPRGRSSSREEYLRALKNN